MKHYAYVLAVSLVIGCAPHGRPGLPSSPERVARAPEASPSGDPEVARPFEAALAEDLSADSFRKAIVGRWTSVFHHNGRRNVQDLELRPDGTADVVLIAACTSKRHSGAYAVMFERAPAPGSATLATITVEPPDREAVVLSRVNFGLHNAVLLSEELLLRIDEEPYGVLKRAD